MSQETYDSSAIKRTRSIYMTVETDNLLTCESRRLDMSKGEFLGYLVKQHAKQIEHEELELAITREEVYSIVERLNDLEETMIAVKDYLATLTQQEVNTKDKRQVGRGS